MADHSSASYIHMVQHLIENCLIFHMSKEECMEALSKHSSIKPVITSTVWNELEKENGEFFKSYYANQSKSADHQGRMSEEETSQMIHKMISESSGDQYSDDTKFTLVPNANVDRLHQSSGHK